MAEIGDKHVSYASLYVLGWKNYLTQLKMRKDEYLHSFCIVIIVLRLIINYRYSGTNFSSLTHFNKSFGSFPWKSENQGSEVNKTKALFHERREVCHYQKLLKVNCNYNSVLKTLGFYLIRDDHIH